MKKQLFFGMVLVSFSLAAQSPWPRSKAGFFGQLAWQTIPTYKTVFESENQLNVPLDRELTEHTLQLYGEYGLSRRISIAGALPLRYLQSGEFTAMGYAAPETAEGSLFGFGNASLSVKTAILQRKIRLTGTLRMDFPSNSYDDPTGLRTGYEAWTLQPGLSTGMGLGKVYWFAYSGYGFRSHGYSQYVNAGAELGVKAWKFWLVGFSELLYSLENGELVLPINQRIKNLYVDKQGWWSIGAKTIFEVNHHWGVTASFAGAGWAQFVPKSPGISLGVYYKRD